MKTVIEMAREANIKQAIETPHLLMVDELERFAELVRADERNSWPAEMEAMERQVNILTDALAQAKADERERIYFQTSSDFVKAAIAEEREACAKVVEPTEEHRRDASWGYLGGTEGVELLDGMAAAIRARSNT